MKRSVVCTIHKSDETFLNHQCVQYLYIALYSPHQQFWNVYSFHQQFMSESSRCENVLKKGCESKNMQFSVLAHHSSHSLHLSLTILMHIVLQIFIYGKKRKRCCCNMIKKLKTKNCFIYY